MTRAAIGMLVLRDGIAASSRARVTGAEPRPGRIMVAFARSARFLVARCQRVAPALQRRAGVVVAAVHRHDSDGHEQARVPDWPFITP